MTFPISSSRNILPIEFYNLKTYVVMKGSILISNPSCPNPSILCPRGEAQDPGKNHILHSVLSKITIEWSLQQAY